MPCYVCAISSQGIPWSTGFITATTVCCSKSPLISVYHLMLLINILQTHCPSCSTQAPPTVYPCSTCDSYTLTATCPWQTTPAVPYAVPYTAYRSHSSHEHCTNCKETGYSAMTAMPHATYETQSSYEPCTTCEETSYSATKAAGMITTFQATFTADAGEAMSSKTVPISGSVSPITSWAPVVYTGGAAPIAIAKIGTIACAGLMVLLAL
jgi:hypothetical protein